MGRYQWPLRVASLAVVVFAATSGSVGTFALGGFDPSVATAPLLGNSGDGTIVVQGLASDGPAEPPDDPPSSGASSSDEPEDTGGDNRDDGDGPLAFLDEMPRTLSAGEVRILAREAGWPEGRLDEVVAVARCESTFNPRARNAWNGNVYGLMQVHRLWFNHAGISLSQWHNPLVNLKVALAAFNYDINRGNPPWSQWVCKPWGHASAAGGEGSSGATPAPTAVPDTPAPSPTPVPDTPTPAPTATPAPTQAPPDGDGASTPAPSPAAGSPTASPVQPGNGDGTGTSGDDDA